MMKPLEYRFNLDLLDQSSHTILNARQGDNCSKMIVTLSEGDKPYAVEDGAVIIFVALKPDGHYIYDNCSVENGCIIYAFNDQTVPVSGMVACQFKLLGGDGEGNRLTTPVFRMAVNSNVNVDEEQIVSSDTYTVLTDLIDEIHHDLDTGAFIGPQGPAGPEGAQGPKGDTGAKGDPGNDGDTPLISSVHLDTGPHKNHTEVIFTYHDGKNKSVYLPDGVKGDTGATGEKGDPGEDGYSPTATVTKSGTQTTIKITDKNGTTTATVNDGAKGDKGDTGATGAKGDKGDPGEGWVTPEQYGAKGDGVHDDTAAINASLAENQFIIFTGKYAVNTIANTSGSTKYGIRIPSNRTLLFAEDAALIGISNQSNVYTLVFISDAENITIDGMILQCDRSEEVYLKINGPHPTDCGNGLIINGSKNITLKNCEVFNALGDGIGIWHSGDDEKPGEYTISENISIENSRIHGNRRNGISIGSSNTICIKGCEIYDNGLNVTYPNTYNVPVDNDYGLVVEGDNVIAPGINPRAGVDIEPNYSHNAVDNITFENCIFYGNGGFDMIDTAVGNHTALSLINCTARGGSALNGNIGAYFGNADAIVTGGRYSQIVAGAKPNILVDHAIINKVVSASVVRGRFRLSDCTVIGSDDFPGTFANGAANCLIECCNCRLVDGKNSNMANTGALILRDCIVEQSSGQFLMRGQLLFADSTEFHFEGNTTAQTISANSMQFINCDFYYNENRNYLLHIDSTTAYTWFNNRFHNAMSQLSPKANNLINNWFNFPSTQLAGSASGERIGNIWTDIREIGTYTSQQIDALLLEKADLSALPTKVSELTNDAGYLKQHQDISGKENTSNKVTSISASASNTQYPSALAVKNYVDSVLGDIETLLSEV